MLTQAEVRVTPRATRESRYKVSRGRRIREITSVVQKRLGFLENSVEHFAEKSCEPCSVARRHRQKLSDTNLLAASLFDDLAVASSDSAWKMARRASR